MSLGSRYPHNTTTTKKRKRPAEASRCFYFFLPDPNVGCQPAGLPFWLGAAAIVLTFSFFGFFASRLPFCSPFAIPSSLVRWQAMTPGGILAASLKRYRVFNREYLTTHRF